MIVKQDKTMCCGCTACQSICSRDAISMVSDDEGFLYPQIDDSKCVNCNLCREVCNFDSDKVTKLSYEQKYYAGTINDRDVHRRSRSGGIFYALAQKVLGNNGIVYGVVMNEDLRAVYRRVDSIDDLSSLQGSKYVQAEVGTAYQEVKKDLLDGCMVLFSGTACYVAGLKAFLQAKNIDMTNLYAVDVVCHGAPSPKIFEDNIRDIEKRYKRKVVSVDFRDKRFGWSPHIESYVLNSNQDSKETKKMVYSIKYTAFFYAYVIMRPSCHKCVHTNFDRPGDITIADCWGIREKLKSQYEREGLSQVMINTSKGQEMFESISQSCVSVFPITKEEASKQPNLFHPTPCSDRRDDFWATYRDRGYTGCVRKFVGILERCKLPYNMFKAKLREWYHSN